MKRYSVVVLCAILTASVFGITSHADAGPQAYGMAPPGAGTATREGAAQGGFPAQVTYLVDMNGSQLHWDGAIWTFEMDGYGGRYVSPDRPFEHISYCNGYGAVDPFWDWTRATQGRQYKIN